MTKFFWFQTVVNAWELALEASAVMSLRGAKLSAGGPEASAEAVRMVGEKLHAAFALQSLAVSGRLGGSALAVTHGAVGHYRGIVGANLHRLGLTEDGSKGTSPQKSGLPSSPTGNS